MEKLMQKDARVDLFGKAVISPAVREICPRAFDGRKALRCVHVPGTVKRIHSRAFADCPNLKSVILDEGIEQIDGNVFTDCSALQELVLPDSIRLLDGWSFYQFTGLQAPAYNRSKTILYCYPCTAPEPVFQVPSHVKRINGAAFLGNPYLQQVYLPDGLTTLESRTFLDIGIRRVVIPPSVKTIQEKAFWNCGQLEEVVILGKRTVIEEGAFFRCSKDVKLTMDSDFLPDERLHLFGRTFLQPVKLDPTSKAHHEDPTFRKLAQRCSTGNIDAMWQMANYFSELGNEPFHICAANFWRYRAHQYGNPTATRWITQWMADHPGKQMASVLNETLDGYFPGMRLRDAGFLFFDPERSYLLTKKDACGIVEASAWSSTEDADSDGFGMEECYDWWLLDEHLKPIPGVEMIHDFSRIDREANTKRFQARYEKAVTALRK